MKRSLCGQLSTPLIRRCSRPPAHSPHAPWRVQVVLYLSRVAPKQTIGHLVHEALQQISQPDPADAAGGAWPGGGGGASPRAASTPDGTPRVRRCTGLGKAAVDLRAPAPAPSVLQPAASAFHPPAPSCSCSSSDSGVPPPPHPFEPAAPAAARAAPHLRVVAGGPRQRRRLRLAPRHAWRLGPRRCLHGPSRHYV